MASSPPQTRHRVLDLWTSLIPLAIGSAVLPLQITVTILLLRAHSGRAKALAWVGGMTLVRVAQWLVLGGIVEQAVDDGEPGSSAVEAAFLLVIAVVFLLAAARKATNQPDEDAPPPRWMTSVSDVTPGRAALMGAGVVGLSPKLWAFTLGAIGAIGDAGLGSPGAFVTFLAFVVLAQSVHLALIGVALVVPARADVLLARTSAALERHNRSLVIGLSLVFGIWLLVKSLAAFGIL